MNIFNHKLFIANRSRPALICDTSKIFCSLTDKHESKLKVNWVYAPMYARSKKCVGVDPLCIPAYPSMLNPFLGLPPGSLHTPSKPLYVKLSPFLAASPPKPSLFSPPSTPLPKPPSVSQRLLSAQPPAGELARGISCCI